MVIRETNMILRSRHTKEMSLILNEIYTFLLID